jgi:hypothetical protein
MRVDCCFCPSTGAKEGRVSSRLTLTRKVRTILVVDSPVAASINKSHNMHAMVSALGGAASSHEEWREYAFG